MARHSTARTSARTSAGPSGAEAPAEAERFHLSTAHQRVFIGLMLGMLVASISQTIVGPAMPRIVAELGGMDHYSWIATAPMLVSAISVPIIGKFADLYGRRRFFLAGLAVFALGSLLSGFAANFWVLIGTRALQGLGMGALMPLSQTIIGDIIPPRQRGKYQGYMGAVFGLASVAGPLAGGFITDAWGWRWLFFVPLPIAVAAFFVIVRFLHIPHERRVSPIDVGGIVTLSSALLLVLLATSLGGTTLAWTSWEIITMYAVGALLLVVFARFEARAVEPVIPLRLFRSSIFSFSIVSSLLVAMLMFGATIYIPVYAQGVLGVGATNSGLILMPLMMGLILVSVASGWLITRTGRYKEISLLGVVVLTSGYWLLTRMGADSGQVQLTLAMAVVGIGLGGCQQVYTLVVQNAVLRTDLGVATAAVQFFRNVGSTVGIAVFGTVMTSRLPDAILSHLPAGAAGQLAASGSGSSSVGSVLDPDALAALPAAVATAVRAGLADALHDVFVLGVPLGIVAFVTTLGIRAIPLRDTVHTADESGRELLDALASSSTPDLAVPLGRDYGHTRTGERLLGIELDLLCDQAVRGDRPLLKEAIGDIGDGDFERGMNLLGRTAAMLRTEDPQVAARSEKYAVVVAERGRRTGGALSRELRAELISAAATTSSPHVLTTLEPTIAQQYEGLDVSLLRTVGHDLTAALLVDLYRQKSQDVSDGSDAVGPGSR